MISTQTACAPAAAAAFAAAITACLHFWCVRHCDAPGRVAAPHTSPFRFPRANTCTHGDATAAATASSHFLCRLHRVSPHITLAPHTCPTRFPLANTCTHGDIANDHLTGELTFATIGKPSQGGSNPL